MNVYSDDKYRDDDKDEVDSKHEWTSLVDDAGIVMCSHLTVYTLYQN